MPTITALSRSAAPTSAAPSEAQSPTSFPRNSSAAGAVLRSVVRNGPTFRSELVDATGLSNATVNRQVVRLLDSGLLRERPDLVPLGAMGRRRIPVEVEPDDFGVLGIHVGLRRTTLAAGDLRGRVIGAVDVPNPHGTSSEVISLLIRRLHRFGAQWPRRRMLYSGLVVGGQLSADRGRLRHDRLGWKSAPISKLVDQAVHSDVVVVPQVEAMAGAEMMRGRLGREGSALYVYAREAVGAVLAVDGAFDVPTTGPGTISHLPVGGSVRCHCGATGCLEAAVGDSEVAAAAHRAGIVGEPSITRVIAAAEGGNRSAHELLAERATLLGRGVALVRDVFNPDRVVLLGQAFTGYRPGLAHVSAGFASGSVLGPLSLQVSPIRGGVQALAACTAALGPILTDPLGVVLRSDARRGSHSGGPRVAAAR